MTTPLRAGDRAEVRYLFDTDDDAGMFSLLERLGGSQREPRQALVTRENYLQFEDGTEEVLLRDLGSGLYESQVVSSHPGPSALLLVTRTEDPPLRLSTADDLVDEVEAVAAAVAEYMFLAQESGVEPMFVVAMPDGKRIPVVSAAFDGDDITLTPADTINCDRCGRTIPSSKVWIDAADNTVCGVCATKPIEVQP